MKQKFTYDEESSKVLDIISDTIILDFSYVYSNYDGFSWTLMNLLDPATHNTDFASYYTKNLPKQKARLKEIQKAFDDMSK